MDHSASNPVASSQWATLIVTAKPKLDGGSLINSIDFANKIQITIDAAPFEMSWGERSFQLHPGRHLIAAGLKNLLYGRHSKAELWIELQPGQLFYLRYRLLGFTIFSGGVLELDPLRQPVAVVPPRPGCFRCAQPLAEGAAFCTQCGARQSDNLTRQCTQCHNAQAQGDFCVQCGQAFAR